MKKSIILGLLLVFLLTGCNGQKTEGEGMSVKDILTSEEAQAKAEKFINNNLLPPDSEQKATVAEVTEENNLYKLEVKVADQTIESYMTKDGEKFFSQALDIDEVDKARQESEGGDSASQQNQPATEVSQKSDKPVVDLFVMSHCPYGTQMEKAILPVAKALGDKIDFNLKFCDYAMHGKKEIDEQLREHCIQKEQPEKLFSYLDCFLESSDSDSCQSEVGINSSQLETCVNSTDKEFGVTEAYNDKNTWRGNYPSFSVYAEENQELGISGSPALVINGEKIQAQRNSASLLDTVCSAFNEAPGECETDLPASTPAPGFGGDESASNSAGSCS